VAVSEAKTVEAEFKSTAKAKFALKVTKTGTGTGKVTSSPAGIDCGATCSFEFEEGTEVTLSASAEAGSTFAGWSGSGCSGTGTCKVTMSAAKEVTATFTLETHLLSVTKKGTGTGTVTSSPAGINCGSECSAAFNHGTAVTLTGAPGAKTKAVAWSGCDSVNGENKCLVTMSTAKSVTATFDLEPTPEFALEITIDGTGSGIVECEVEGGPAEACEAKYPEGTEVALLPEAEPGSEFTGFSGDCTGTGPCELTMSAAKKVTASFKIKKTEVHKLSITETGAGSGKVVSTPEGIDCGSECEAEFEEGSTVKLTATPEAGSEFREWTGACSGATSTCEVTMTEAKTINARFSHARPLLTLEKSGYGSVKAKPKGIGCGNTCYSAVGQYYNGTVVVLSAKAPLTGGFTSWEGCKVLTQTELESTCEVTMSSAKAVKATFKAAAKPIVSPQTLTLTKAAGTGYGTVKATGIICEAACTTTQVPYYGGVTEPKPKAAATVTLLAVPAIGSSFAGWEGCESEPEGKCVVLMSKAQSVTAQFDAKPKLALILTKEGYGSVKAKPKGIGCGNTCYSGVASLPEGTVVVLSAKAPLTGGFTGWEGCKVLTQTELESTCEVTMSSAKAVKATFKAAAKPIVNPQTLTLTKEGTGTGTVKATGLICETACTATEVPYYGGVTEPKPKAAATVTLLATSTLGSDPVEWSGCESEPEGKCVVLMSKAQSVTATFEE
jgi:hypothetical protein